MSEDWDVAPGLDSGIFATTVRDDGQLQLVAGKWPLYYFAGDAVPETLDPLLRRQFAEQVPVLTDAAARLYAWAEGKRAGERVPRSIGRHAFRVGERVGEREVITYSLWMWQRPLDAYQALDDDGRAAVDGWLARIDQAGALARPLPQRLELVHHRCVLGRRAPADEAA